MTNSSLWQNIHFCHRVGQVSESNDLDERILGTITGNYGEEWREVLLDLKKAQTSFQLFLEAVIGQSYLGDIAVDDIQLLDKEKCEKVAKTTLRSINKSNLLVGQRDLHQA